MPVAPGGDRGAAAGRLSGSAKGFSQVQQGGLIVLRLDDDLCSRLCGRREIFSAVNGIERDGTTNTT